jgi:succinate dehydrogenase / fumarate reductase cytochrome b subunit
VNWLTKTATSTVGRKFFAGLSGLALVGFLVMHLIGNLNLYVSPEAMDAYGHFLHMEIPGFLAIEYGLLAIFLIHIGFVMSAVLRNRAARPSRYQVNASKRAGGASTLASKTMALSGITLIVFIVVHVAQLRLRIGMPSEEEQGIGLLVIDTLQNPLLAALYIAGALLAGWHVFHGFQSAFRSVGVGHSKYMGPITKLGMAVGVLIGLGFASFPILILAGFIDADGTPLAPLFEWIHPLPPEGH